MKKKTITWPVYDKAAKQVEDGTLLDVTFDKMWNDCQKRADKYCENLSWIRMMGFMK